MLWGRPISQTVASITSLSNGHSAFNTWQLLQRMEWWYADFYSFIFIFIFFCSWQASLSCVSLYKYNTYTNAYVIVIISFSFCSRTTKVHTKCRTMDIHTYFLFLTTSKYGCLYMRAVGLLTSSENSCNEHSRSNCQKE